MPRSDVAAAGGAAVLPGAGAPSESARATTAAESRYRVAGPNSLPRRVAVVAVDAPSGAVVDDLADRPWGHARFHHAPELADTAALVDDVGQADLVVLVASAGQDVPSAAVIGDLCRLNRVATTTLVVSEPGADRDATAWTLTQLRPHSDVLVTTSSADCYVDLLVALRA